MSRIRQRRHSALRPTPIALALGSALAGVVLTAHADPVVTIAASIASQSVNAGHMITAAGSGIADGTAIQVTPSGQIGVLSNAGTLSAGAYGLYNQGTIISLDNSGDIRAPTAIGNTGLLSTLTNTGTIVGSTIAIQNSGTLVSIGNSGLISAPTLIAGTGLIGTISNSGMLAGNITHEGGNLSIVGGSGSTVGTLSGYGGTFGTLNNSSGNLSLSGNLLVTDDIHVGSHTLVASGTLRIGDQLSLFGNMQLDSGATLALDTRGTLLVSGQTTLAGTISARIDNTGTYLAGGIRTLVSAGTLSDTSTVSINTPSALAFDTTVTGTNLLLTYHNDYVGGVVSAVSNGLSIGGVDSAVYIAAGAALATFSNTGTLTGNLYAIESRGTLGLLQNSGLVRGNILIQGGLSIAGNGGTLTGGTITAGNLGFSGGRQLLDDAITVGSGTVAVSNATLAVNRAVTIAGNYSQRASATLQVGVADGSSATGNLLADSGYGRLVVNGNANIDAGSGVLLARTGSHYAFAQGQRYVVLAADSSGTDYHADALHYSAAGYAGSVTGAVVADGSNSDLVLTLGAAAGNSATEDNARQALGGLLNYHGTQSGLLDLYNAAIAAESGDSGAANRIGRQLSPAGSATANTALALAEAGAAADVLRNRLGQLRGSGIATGDEAPDRSVWAQLYGGHVNQGDHDGTSGYSADFSGLLLGADRSFGERWHAGAAAVLSQSALAQTGANSGSSVHNHGYGIHGYAGYDADRWYLDLDAGIDRLQYNSLRLVSFGGFSSGAQGNYTGTQYALSAELGWPLRLDTWWHDTTLTPILDLAWTRLEQSGYTESGGNGAALTVGALGDNSVTSQLGARLAHAGDTAWGRLTPYLQLGWRHEYRNTRLQTTASFAADTTGTTSFTNEGAAPQRDMAVLALGATLAKTQRLSLSGQLQITGGASYAGQSLNLTVKYRF